MNKKVFALRHLKTEDNLRQRFCSGDRDISILPGQIFNPATTEMIQKIDKVIIAHTGLKRTYETACLLKKTLNYSGNILLLPEFAERFGGKLAGLSFNKIQHIFPKLKKPCQLWNCEAPEFGLENITDFLSRIQHGLRKLCKISEPVVLIAHAGSVKGIYATTEGQTLEEQRMLMCRSTPKNAELFVFKLKGDTLK